MMSRDKNRSQPDFALHPLRQGAVALLMACGALVAGPALAQADPPPSTQSNPAAAAVRTPVAPPSARVAPAAPVIVAKSQGPSEANGVAAAEARYARERARCESGQSQQDRPTCLQEAGAALAEARRHALDTNGNAAARRANVTERCQPLPDQERRDCEARMIAGETEGSVNSGGVIRELKVIEVSPGETPPPVPAPKP